MTAPPHRPAQTLGEILEDREHLRRALRLIADTVDAIRRPDEVVKLIGEVAKAALGEPME
jgi:hypothetical protein